LGGVKSTSYAINIAARSEAIGVVPTTPCCWAADATVLEGATEQRVVAFRQRATNAGVPLASSPE